jgi:hypothetical protein
MRIQAYMRFVGCAVALSAPTVSLAAPPPTLSAALDDATDICTGGSETGEVQLKLDWDQYMNVPRRVPQIKLKTFADLPALAQRYLMNAPSVRAFGRPTFVLHSATTSGEVFVLPSDAGMCDAFVSSAPDIVQSGLAYAESLGRKGWHVVKGSDAAQSMPLSQRVMIRMSPQPDAQNFGHQAKVQWLPQAAGDGKGIQMELNFTSGIVKRP